MVVGEFLQRDELLAALDGMEEQLDSYFQGRYLSPLERQFAEAGAQIVLNSVRLWASRTKTYSGISEWNPELYDH